MVSPDSSITSEQRAACRAALRDLFGSEVKAVGTEDHELEVVCPENEEISMIGAGIAASEAVSAGKDVGLSYLGDMFSARQMARGYKYAKKMMKKGPSYQVQGLRRAGLNPILAAGGMQMGGSSAIPTHSAKSVSAGRSGAFMDYMSARNLGEQNKLLQAQTLKTKADARKATMEANAIATSGLGATTTLGRFGHSLGTGLGRVFDPLIEIFNPSTGQWSAKGGKRRGKVYRYKLAPDTGRSGYEQRLMRIQ